MPSYLPADSVLEAEVQKFLILAAGEIAFFLRLRGDYCF